MVRIYQRWHSFLTITDEMCRTWPVNEQVIDVMHKAVYAFVTGYLTDRWLQ